MIRRTTIAGVLVLMATPVVLAQEPITLEEAIARALKHSARVAEMDARRAGAEAAETGAAATRLPVVALGAGYTRTNHVDEFGIVQPGQAFRVIYPDVPDNFRSRIDLQWPIYSGGRTTALGRAARAEKTALGHDLAAVQAEVRLEVTRAFWAVVTARETERVLARAVDRMTAHVADLRARLTQGLIAPNEVTTGEAARSRQQLLAIEAGNQRRVAEVDLQLLVGSFPSPVVPVEPSAAVRSKAETDQMGRTPFFRPEHKALEERIQAARAREEAVEASKKPAVAAAAGYDYARPNPRIFPRAARWDDSWDVGVNVTWTLWDGGRRRAEQAEASAGTRALEARRSELQRQLGLELSQRYFEVDSSRAAISVAEDGVRSALETQRVVGERYRAGVATSIDVLDAEVALLQAELDRTRALANERLALARLERAAGR